MDLISVWFEDETCRDRAEQLSKKFNLSLFETRPSSDLCLYVGLDRLAIGFSAEKPFRPYSVDFESPEWRFRQRRGLKENKTLLAAAGVKPGWTLLDAHAGFGQDTFVFGWGGAGVTAVERSPVVYELLVDGMRRAFHPKSIWTHSPALQLVNMDSADYLRGTEQEFDAVYLDPMFDKPKKSAKSPKPMQLLQTLLEDDEPNLKDLMEAARGRAKNRVIVKLPLKAEPLDGEPDIRFPGQSIRYDVYLQ